MATVRIPDELLKHLQVIAKREGRSVAEITEKALEQFKDAHWVRSEQVEQLDESVETNDLFTLVVRAARELGEGSGQGNISERSRELLATDFAEYLMRRHKGQL